MSITDKELDLYIENGLNVLFEGKHGVGKTAMVKEAFDRNNLNWKYFSAATMDPWVDFVGIPRAIENDGDEPYIELTRPKGFHNDSVQAIFMDELNRAPKKVRNAVMELIQFKSINGVAFPNLKVIWAAINPDDDEESDVSYDVETLDPAQKDRFHITVEIPYKPSFSYFQKAYGTAGEGAVEWWNSLSKEKKELVSPRRLEYALQVNTMGGSLRHVLRDATLNTSKLVQMIEAGSLKKRLRELFVASDDEITQAFSNMNFTTNVFDLILKENQYITKFIKYIPKDIVSDILFKGDKNAQKIVENGPDDYIDPILESIADSDALNVAKKKKLAKVYGGKAAFTNKLPTKMKPTVSGTLMERLEKSFTVFDPRRYTNTQERRNALYKIIDFINSKGNKRITHEEAVYWMACIASFIDRSQLKSITYPGESKTLVDISVTKLCTLRGLKTVGDTKVLWDSTKQELMAPNNKRTILKSGNRLALYEIDNIEKSGAII